MKLIILFGVFGLSIAAHFSDGPCPERPVMKNFNLTALAGEWYDIKKYSNVYDHGFECTYLLMKPIGENMFKATRCEKINQQSHCMKYMVNPAEDHGFFSPSETTGRYTLDLHVFYTNHSKYLILYQCHNTNDNRSFDYLWILSRTPEMEPEILNEALMKAGEHFNIEHLKFVKQDKEYCGNYIN